MYRQSYCWYRGDDLKSSKIYVEVKDVSISNENDWIKMANFHSVECKKMYSVFNDILAAYFSR